MDNPQHYQPLSHALHPPHAQFSSTPTVYDPKSANTHRQEEEEEEDDDDDDEGMVEQQLQNEPEGHPSNSSSPQSRPGTTTGTRATQQDSNSHDSGGKRRPGRPRGSKNRKPRTGGPSVKQQEGQFYYQGLQPTTGTTPPQHPDINVHNQQYYEFQWRVLNLCAEFYNAAEELVKGTPPLVIAQSYQMGPTTKVDPLIMLGDAKRICDTLLANPSQLITSPPPPMYTVIPPIYQSAQPPPTATSSAPPGTTAAASTSKASTTSATPVISNPQSFVVSLGSSQSSFPQYPVYTAPPGQYPAAPYYSQYSPYGSPYYPPSSQQPPTQPSQPTQQQTAPTPQPPASSSSAPPIIAAGTSTNITAVSGSPASGVGINQGAWSDEETERLKKLAEDSRSVGSSGEIEWDWVVHQWGNGRTRHQILIKATSLGLKESTSRGTKRRRENEVEAVASPTTPAVAAGSSNTITITAPPVPSTSTPAVSITTASPPSTATPGPSPALTHSQRPPPPPKTASNHPWPMPTVAANTPSPIAPVQTQGDQQRTSYYRPRPSDSVVTGSGPGKNVQPGPGTQHQFMYQPNGSGSRLGKENGK